MRSRGVSRQVVLLAIVVIGAAVFGYMAIQPVVPPPSESNRVHHPGGFSIIVPDRWENHIDIAINGQGSDSIEGLPKKAEGYPGVYTLTRLRDAPTEAKLADTHFVRETLDGKPIWVARSENTNHHRHTIIYAFPQRERWYQITITRELTEPIEGPPWTDYVRSFRDESVGPASKPAG